MKRLHGGLAHALAAEYVIGTLRGGARRRFEGWMREDPSLLGVVRTWEEELMPLLDEIPPIEPHARVWAAIERRISESRDYVGSGRIRILWRKSAAVLAGGIAALLLIAVLLFARGPTDEPVFVAVLSNVQGVPSAVVSMHAPDVLRIRMVKPMPDLEGRDLELWAIAKIGPPRSLGVVTNPRGDNLMHIRTEDARMMQAQALAMSIEPRGGSPTQKPTGPVVMSGPIAAMSRG